MARGSAVESKRTQPDTCRSSNMWPQHGARLSSFHSLRHSGGHPAFLQSIRQSQHRIGALPAPAQPQPASLKRAQPPVAAAAPGTLLVQHHAAVLTCICAVRPVSCCRRCRAPPPSPAAGSRADGPARQRPPRPAGIATLSQPASRYFASQVSSHGDRNPARS